MHPCTESHPVFGHAGTAARRRNLDSPDPPRNYPRRDERNGSPSEQMAGRALFIVVSGPPASGKSTLAPLLANELRLPLIAKDTIKDALMSVLAVPDVETSRQIGRAAVVAMLAVAAESVPGAVIESNFYRSVATDPLSRLPGTMVEVFCRCSAAVAAQRCAERAGSRHVGHFDRERTPPELWNDEISEPVGGGWPVIDVNTEQPLDIADIVGRVEALAGL